MIKKAGEVIRPSRSIKTEEFKIQDKAQSEI